LCGDDDENSGIPEAQAGFHAFWGGVHGVGNGLNAGIEVGAALNPVTSLGIALNKAGEGKYGQAALFALPAVGALGGEGGAVADAAGGGKLPEVVFDYNRNPELVDNIWNAQKAGYPDVLTYGGSGVIKANRSAATDAVQDIAGLTKDEYPFASTREGGAESWVGHVPGLQQKSQGGILHKFYRTIGVGDRFRVVVINHPRGP
jgi:hypothetical protein